VQLFSHLVKGSKLVLWRVCVVRCVHVASAMRC
jgi:hypothetical protein